MVRHSAGPALLLIALLAGCGRSEAARAPSTAEEAAAMVADAVKGRAKEPVDPKSLGELLPSDLGGLTRVDLATERNGAMGMVLTVATGRYEGSDNRLVTVAVSDIGALGGLGPFGSAAWAISEFDRTTATGYERTTRFDGFKAMESQSNQGGRLRTELSIIVADRFIVQIKGRGVDVDALKDAARSIGLRRLANLG